MRTKNVFKKKSKIIFLTLILIQTIVCIWMMNERAYLFTDEVYSYGLANCESNAFIDPEQNPTLNNWTNSDFFANYTRYDNSVPFSFNAAFKNQAADVHPPMYYILLHIVCAFFPNAVYDPVPGILLNYIFLLLSDICLYFLAKFFFKDDFTAIAVVVFWGLSSACFSDAVLIRMYMLQTFQLLLLATYHFVLFNNSSQKTNWLKWLGLVLIVAFGGLTHYYFYFFAATLGFFMCVALLVLKRFKDLVIYALSLWGGVGLALLIFPATFQHIFGYRGEYATQNIGTVDYEKFSTYFHFINESLLGNGACFILLLIIVALLVRLFAFFFTINIQREDFDGFLIRVCPKKVNVLQEKKFEVGLFQWQILSIALATIAFGYVAIQGSQIQSNRYIYGTYPFLALFLVGCLSSVLKRVKMKKAIIITFCVIVPIISVFTYGIEWRYSDYPGDDAITSFANSDVIVIGKDGKWMNLEEGYPIYLQMDEVRIAYESSIDNIQTIIDERKTPNNPIAVAFISDNINSDEEINSILNRIVDSSRYTGWKLAYDYYTKVYLLT